jgi:hypothetical protein
VTDRRNPDPEPDDAAWNRPDTPSPAWGQAPPGGPPADPGRPPGPSTGSWTPGPPSAPPYQAPSSGPPGPYPGQFPPGGAPPPAGWTGAPGVRPTNTLAILALVASFVISPAGLIMGVIARQQIRQRHEGGDGLALAAINIGVIGTVGYLLFCIGLFADTSTGY